MSVVLLLEFPEVAVTVTLYVLAGVPDDPEPPWASRVDTSNESVSSSRIEKRIREEELMARTPVETRQGPTALDEAGAEPGHSL